MRSGKTQEALNTLIRRTYQSVAVGDGVADEFPLPITVLRADDLRVYLAGALKRPADSGGAWDYRIRGLHEHTPASSTAYPGDSNTIKFTVIPVPNAQIGLVAAGG